MRFWARRPEADVLRRGRANFQQKIMRDRALYRAQKLKIKNKMEPVKNHLKGFMEFVRTQGVVGLAVGFILGGAVSTVVKSLVDDIINPVVGILLNQAKSLTDLVIKIGEAQIKLGSFINVLINFAIISAVVYFGVKILKLDKLDKSKS
jgi:large conductance mechanosensitive channel